jgi:hypothetical protein
MQYPKMLFCDEKAVKIDGGYLTATVCGLRGKSGIQFQLDFRREGEIDFFAQEIRDTSRLSAQRIQTINNLLKDAPVTGITLAVNGDNRDALIVLLRSVTDVLEKQGVVSKTITSNKNRDN